jgi:phosphomannomutase
MTVRSYLCPGEVQPVSRSVHLARLAADYAKCSVCPHCSDLGGIGLPPRPAHVETPLAPVLQGERIWRSLRSPDARREILKHCEALTAVLWRETPWDLPLNDWDVAEGAGPNGPDVCVAWQASDIAESFATDVTRAISRSGCRVNSLGAVPRPAFDFAVDHLECAAGVWVEGGGSPAGLGFRVTGRKSSSWSEQGRLEAVASARQQGAGRPCRAAGVTKSFDILPAYRESLLRHFASARGDLAVGGWSDGLRSVWRGLESRAACRFHETGLEARCDDVPLTANVRGLQEEVIRQRLQGGILFGADGRQVWFVDRREGLLPDREVAERLAEELRGEAGEGEVRIVASEELMWTELRTPGVRVLASGAGEERLVEAMLRTRAVLGCDGQGRYWIAKPVPRCDGLLTLAYLSRGENVSESQRRAG